MAKCHGVTVGIDPGRQDDPEMTKKSGSAWRLLLGLAVDVVVVAPGLWLMRREKNPPLA
jgi:hypothetical protein